MSTQLDLHLPRRDTDEILRDELADCVDRFNSEADDGMRQEILFGRITVLRRLLFGAAPPNEKAPGPMTGGEDSERTQPSADRQTEAEL